MISSARMAIDTKLMPRLSAACQQVTAAGAEKEHTDVPDMVLQDGDGALKLEWLTLEFRTQ